MKRILLIDDDEGIQIVWKRFHELTEPVFRGQLEMDIASNLEQALAKIQGGAYDAVIQDLTIPPNPQERGVEWLAENAAHLPPIIVLTGDSDIFLRRRCMMLGAADFWLKDDAQSRPDLFFKAIYNEYLKRYSIR